MPVAPGEALPGPVLAARILFTAQAGDSRAGGGRAHDVAGY
jgi:hypothetical protein